jgi:hypothetical protein
MTPFQGRRVDDVFPGKPDAKPGDFEFFASARQPFAGLFFVCPCGCGDVRGLPFRNGPAAWDGEPSWTWDGDEERPTLSPSILRTDGCKWHGYLKSGIWSTS